MILQLAGQNHCAKQQISQKRAITEPNKLRFRLDDLDLTLLYHHLREKEYRWYFHVLPIMFIQKTTC